MRYLCPTLLIVALSTNASAQAIDAPGAAQLSKSLSHYISQAAFDKNIVKIVPDGDAYRIDLDFKALAALVPAQVPVKFEVAPFALRVKPRPDGTWQVDGPLMPDGWFEAGEGPEQLRLQWAVTDGKSTGIYDPELAAFASASASYAGIKLKSKEATGEDETSYGAGSMTMTASRSANGGVDISSRQEFGGFAQTKSLRIPNSSVPFVATVKAAALSAESTGAGVRTKSLLDLLAFGIANADYERVKANQAELKSLLLAALPFWDRIGGTYALSDLQVISPVGILRTKGFNNAVAMDGLQQNGKLSYGFRVSDMAVVSFFLPGWASTLIPTQLDLNLTATNLNLDNPARKLIGSLDLNQDPPVPANVGEEIAAEFKAKPPKIIFSKSTIANANVEVVAEGEMSFPEGKPIVNMTFDATGYDKMLGILEAAAPSDPRITQILPTARFLRNEANTMPGGHLLWKLSTSADGTILLNNFIWKSPQ
jgi:hypothetical protein